MGTNTSNKDTQTEIKPTRCSLCRQEYTPDCNYMQGRCPHHPSMLDTILSDSYKSRFYNLIKFFKGKK